MDIKFSFINQVSLHLLKKQTKPTFIRLGSQGNATSLRKWQRRHLHNHPATVKLLESRLNYRHPKNEKSHLKPLIICYRFCSLGKQASKQQQQKINNKKKCPHKIYSRQIMSKKTSVLLIIAVAFAFLLYPTVGFKGLGKQPV